MRRLCLGLILALVVPIGAWAQRTPPIFVKVFTATSKPSLQPSVAIDLIKATGGGYGFHIISGGARAISFDGRAFLTKSFPRLGSDTVWEADAKVIGSAYPATVDAWVVAIYDTSSNWSVRTVSASASGNSPYARATLPAGYVMTGGGASTTWKGDGNYLIGNSPDTNQSWQAASKSELYPDSSSSVTAYVIGIKPTDDKAPLPSSILVSAWSKTPDEAPQMSVMPDRQGYTIVGGGAVDYWSGAGNMLTASYPTSSKLQSWSGAGGDLVWAKTPAIIAVYGIALTNVHMLP